MVELHLSFLEHLRDNCSVKGVLPLKGAEQGPMTFIFQFIWVGNRYGIYRIG